MRRGPSIKTIKKLFAASGGICAFPGCNTRLQDSISGALLGDICHIHAISKDGPRYAPTYPDDDLNEFDNLLILCPTHHRLIDQEPRLYTSTVLRSMKHQHEAFVVDKITAPAIDDKTAVTLARQIASESIDFAIVTALSVEIKAILNYFPELVPISISDRSGFSQTYYRGILSCENGIRYRIVAMLLHNMGNLEAAHATNDLIRDWGPRYLIVNGIAGGLCPKTQKYGDIVVSDSVVYYELGKALSDGIEQRSKHFPCDPSMLNSARTMEKNEWRLYLPKRPDGQPPNITYPNVHFGPLASGEKVIASAIATANLLKYQPNLIAVEMESAGVASAALSALRKIGFMAVRSICDFADESKSDNWQPYAAAAAASFLRSFLMNQPVSPSIGKWPSPTEETLPPKMVMRRELYNQLSKGLDMEEFKDFCFLLGVDVDELPGDRKSARARELILLFERRGKVEELASSLRDMMTNEL